MPSPAHNVGGWVLPLFSQQIFLTTEVEKYDGKMIIAHYLPVLLDSVHQTNMFVSVTFITLLMTAILLICANKINGDIKFYHRKSMRVVSEKLIINEMEPYL